MSTKITILSWNIESFGAGKAAILSPKTGGTKPPPPSKSQIVDFIATVAKQLNVDVLGIMEVKSGIGPLLNGWLLSALNNNGTAGTTWKGAVSSRQDGGTQEEYIYLWKSTATFDLNMSALPGPTSLVNVADEQVFAGLFQAANVTTAADQLQFLQALVANGYLIKGTWKMRSSVKSTKTFRVNPAIWQLLKNATAVSFSSTKNPQPPVAFSPQQLTQIGTILTQLDVLRFITYGDRSPYLINLTLDTKPLTIALYHAPGPQDPTRFDAINIIGMSLPLAPSNPDKNMLLMGDFNISSSQSFSTALVYQRAPDPVNPNGVNFGPVNPRKYATIFDPIQFAPLKTSWPLLPAPTKTSLTSKYVTNTAKTEETEGNVYDNFYFRKSGTAGNELTVVASSANIALPLAAFYPGQGAFNKPIATALLVFFRAFGGVANLTKSLQKAEAAMDKISATVKRSTKNLQMARSNLKDAQKAKQDTATLEKRVKKYAAQVALENAKLSDAHDAVSSLTATGTLVGDNFNTTPAGIGDALTIYRYAISDHLAISFQLQS